MPTYYVDSNATGGTNTGGSWANAYLQFGSAVSAAVSGDTIYVSYLHNEVSAGVALNYAFAANETNNRNPIQVYSTDPTGNIYRIGAKVALDATNSTADFYISGAFFIAGMTFQNESDDFYWAGGDDYRGTFVDCTFRWNKSANDLFGYNAANRMRDFFSCTFENFSGTELTKGFALARHGSYDRFYNCVFTGSQWKPTVVIGGANGGGGRVELYGCDLSGIKAGSGNSFTSDPGPSDIKMVGCSLKETLPPPSTTITKYQSRLIANACGVGTFTAPLPELTYQYVDGNVSHDATVYRAASLEADGDPKYSWKAALTTTNSRWQAITRGIEFPQQAIFLGAGANQTITVHIASSIALNARRLWAICVSPSESNPATARNVVRNSLDLVSQTTDLDGTPAALTTTTSLWTGSGPSNYYKIVFTVSPTLPGMAYIMVSAGEQNAGTAWNCWVCPKLDLA